MVKRRGNEIRIAMMSFPLDRMNNGNSPELAKMTEPTSYSRNPLHHGVELKERNSMVVSIFIGSPWFRWKSSPKFGEDRTLTLDLWSRRGNSRKGLQIWNHRVEMNAVIYV